MQLFFCAFVSLLLTGCDAVKPTFFRYYECVNGSRCRRGDHPVNELITGVGSSNVVRHASLQACRLVCEPTSSLWPIPTGQIIAASTYTAINPSYLQLTINSFINSIAKEFMYDVIETFKKNVEAICRGNCKPSSRKVLVYLQIEDSKLDLNWDTDEGYEMDISTQSGSGTSTRILINVMASTVYGARHGLETLSQLMAPAAVVNGTTELVLLDSVTIKDKPVFQHRGLLIDTARNFLPVSDILRTIDGLASVKMNILHWHATDSQSFPLEIKSVPLMTKYGAYSPDKVYTIKDMELIVKYAKSRGIRVILEIDSPSHAAAGWEWGETEGLGNLVVCANQQPWRNYCIQPPCGQLNPVNPNTFQVLRQIYAELLSIFGRYGMIHIGGDELFINCWNATDEVVEGMALQGLGRTNEDFLKIWSNVHNKQLQILNEEINDEQIASEVIVWSSMLSSPEKIESYLNKSKFIVQTWVESDKDLNEKLLNLGYKLIISTKDAWYLDHGFWGITKYHTWRDVYNNRIPQQRGVLGGEACMWGEYVFEGTLDSRVWPRAAAVAERLWSDPSKITTAKAEPRLLSHIDRLEQRQIHSEAIVPEWCNQHEQECV